MRLTNKMLWRLRRFLFPKPSRYVPRFEAGSSVVVAGLFRTASGIGQSARNCADGLEKEGVRVDRVDLSALFNQVDEELPTFPDRLPDAKKGVVIMHLNAPEVERALFHLNYHRGAAWQTIGYWAWELPVAPDSWKSSARYLSEIWVPSDFVADAVKKLVPNKSVKTVPHWPNVVRGSDQSETNATKLRILVMADGRSSFERKNIIGAIDMFRAAYDPSIPAELVIKTRNAAEFPELARMLSDLPDAETTHLDGNWTRDEVLKLIHSCDIFLSPHRAEGFGLNLSEAMSLGRVVVATGWSGNLEFMTKDNSVLLDFDMEPVRDPHNVYDGFEQTVWAKPLVDSAAEVLADLMSSPNKRIAIGQRAKEDVRIALNPGNYKRALLGLDGSRSSLNHPSSKG